MPPPTKSSLGALMYVRRSQPRSAISDLVMSALAATTPGNSRRTNTTRRGGRVSRSDRARRRVRGGAGGGARGFVGEIPAARRPRPARGDGRHSMTPIDRGGGDADITVDVRRHDADASGALVVARRPIAHSRPPQCRDRGRVDRASYGRGRDLCCPPRRSGPRCNR